MAYYLVQAQPVEELLTELRQRLGHHPGGVGAGLVRRHGRHEPGLRQAAQPVSDPADVGLQLLPENPPAGRCHARHPTEPVPVPLGGRRGCEMPGS